MSKILVKYIKGFETYVPDDIRAIEVSEYKKLKKEGIVIKTEILEEIDEGEVNNEGLIGVNILGVKYKKGLIDVVVPTKSDKNIKSLKILKDAEKGGEITLTLMIREFNEQAGGFARSCNNGAKLNKALGEFVLFLNDDVRLGENFFADLIKPFADAKVGIVGAECSETGFGVNGSVMCIRRELFERIGGFDENYFFMWEDNDMCRNVKRRGFTIAISGADAKHKGKDSINTGSEFWRVNYYKGKNYYEQKWSGGQRLIGSMIVGDENNRYMSRVITDLFKRDLIDEMVVVCDQSNNETVVELEELKKYYPVTIKYHDFKLFGVAENLLRERAVDYAISKNPFGILPIDADEFLDVELTRKGITGLLYQGIAYDLVLAHFWGNEDTVRTDGCFSKQQNIRIFRYCPELSQKFFDRNLHCGSAPIYAYSNRQKTDYILHHFGYIKKRDIEAKKKRQLAHDPKMLLENPDLYNRMIEEGETMKFNKVDFLKIYNQ
jgi:hypothetical protein